MRRKTAYLFIIIVIAGLAVFACLPRFPVLILRNERGKTVARLLCEDGKFVHRYVHSVHLSDVDEEYRIEPDGTLRLLATRFDTLGVGIPYDAENGFTLLDGRFELKMDRCYRSLPIRMSPMPGHVILIGGRTYPLADWFVPGDLVVISANHLPRLWATSAPADNESTQ